MSYGRDASGLQKVGSFRQMGGAIAQKPKKTGGGGGGGGGGFLRWHDKYAPSMLRPDTIRILRGEYAIQYIPMDDEGNALHFETDGRPQVWDIVQPFIKVREH